MKTRCNNGNTVERFYDRSTRSSVTRVLDAGGNQIGDASYDGNKDSANFSWRVMVRDNGGPAVKEKPMKVIERIKKDPRVDKVWNEGEDGWWVMLKTGHICGNSDTHAVHEWSLKSLWNSFRTVKPCSCKDCVAPTS